MTYEPTPHEEPRRSTAVNANNKDTLMQSFVDRIERAMIERKNADDDLKEIVSQCKASGFVPKTIAAMKTVAKLRMSDKGKEAGEKLATLEEVSRAVGFNDLFSWSEDLADRE